MYHPKGLYFHFILDKETCDKFEDSLNDKNFANEKLDDGNRRNCKISWLSPEKNEYIYDVFWHYIQTYNIICNWNFDLQFLESIQYTKYDKDDFYDWHIDTIKTDESTTRKLSVSFLLNENFEGGEFQLETELPSPDGIEKIRYETIPMRRGSFVLFHSGLPHRVTPVTSGVRKSLVAWADGPPFK